MKTISDPCTRGGKRRRTSGRIFPSSNSLSLQPFIGRLGFNNANSLLLNFMCQQICLKATGLGEGKESLGSNSAMSVEMIAWRKTSNTGKTITKHCSA